MTSTVDREYFCDNRIPSEHGAKCLLYLDKQNSGIRACPCNISGVNFTLDGQPYHLRCRDFVPSNTTDWDLERKNKPPTDQKPKFRGPRLKIN